MAIKRDRATLRHLQTLLHDGTCRELSDGQLLERFTTDPGAAAERAFSALVERHGAMVLRVCRSVLIDPHDSEDAFQATFLVLVRKARRLWVRESLGPWLHQVAYRTALCARSRAARRRRHERDAAGRSEATLDHPCDDWHSVLHEEVERLPERFRLPLVVCDLGGQSHEQAARQLGLPIGTVKSRLSRGRDRLRDRLLRRGVVADTRLLPLMLRPEGLDLLLPPALVDSTTTAAVQLLTLRVFASSSAGSLALEVMKVMGLARFWKVAAIGLVLSAGGTGVGVHLRAQKADSGPPALGDLAFPVVVAPNPAQGGAAPAGEAQEVVVQPGTLTGRFIEHGVIQASTNHDVYSNVEGQTTIISIVPEGTKVTKGQIVCELDSASLKDQLVNATNTFRSAEAAYVNARLARELAEAALVEYREGIYKGDHATLKGAVETSQRALTKAQGRLDRTKAALERLNHAMIQPGAGGPADIAAEVDLKDRIEAAEETLAYQTFELESSQTRLMLLEKYGRPRTEKRLQSEIELKRADEGAKQSALALERSKANRLSRQIEICTIKAPSDGMIVYANDPNRVNGRTTGVIEEGATVRERQKILSVPDLDKAMTVVVKVPEAQIAKIRTGQKASIGVDAFPGRTLTGRISVVNPLPDPISFTQNRGKFFTAFVTLDKVFPGLRPGMTAQADMVLPLVENCLLVPVSALVTYQGKHHVAVKSNGAIEWREVIPGESAGKTVEVQSGLKAGETVALNPIALMSDAEKREKFGAPAPAPK